MRAPNGIVELDIPSWKVLSRLLVVGWRDIKRQEWNRNETRSTDGTCVDRDERTATTRRRQGERTFFKHVLFIALQALLLHGCLVVLACAFC